jgi:hypothetical protein
MKRRPDLAQLVRNVAVDLGECGAGGYAVVLLTTYMACPGIRRMRILRGAPNPASLSQLYNCAGVFTCDPELR